MKKIFKRYRAFIVVAAAIAVIALFNATLALSSLKIAGNSFKEMLVVLPPIFILLGLLDVWVPREIMVKHMGDGSGIRGVILSIAIGSAAAGPLYAAFPVAAVLMKKGAGFINVLIFLGAWSTTKIPMFLFELTSLGPKFALTRLIVDIPGIIIIAVVLSAFIHKEEVKKIYENIELMDK